MSGRYEVRREIRLGVSVMAIVWVVPGELPMLLTVLGEERLPLLAEALCDHLHGAEA